jgi:hypothetical protein
VFNLILAMIAGGLARGLMFFSYIPTNIQEVNDILQGHGRKVGGARFRGGKSRFGCRAGVKAANPGQESVPVKAGRLNP